MPRNLFRRLLGSKRRRVSGQCTGYGSDGSSDGSTYEDEDMHAGETDDAWGGCADSALSEELAGLDAGVADWVQKHRCRCGCLRKIVDGRGGDYTAVIRCVQRAESNTSVCNFA